MRIVPPSFVTMASSPPAKKSRQGEENETEDPAVTLFREYLRISTISRGEDYQKHYGRLWDVGVRWSSRDIKYLITSALSTSYSSLV